MSLSWKRIALACVFMCCASGFAWAQWTWTPQTGRFINVKKLPKETAELQLEFARSLMLKHDYKGAIRETGKFKDAFPDSELADQNQFLRGEIRMAQGRYKDAAKEFQKVVSAYPSTTLFDKVIEGQYAIGDSLYQKALKQQKQWWRLFRSRPMKRAIEVYSMVIQNQPFTKAAAQAQYKLGLCHFARKEYLEAAFEYKRVIEDYSDSDWVDKACYDLATSYYKNSLPAEYDQTSSKLAIEAVDDFTTRYPSDDRGDALKKFRVELRERMAHQRWETAQYYEKRRDFEAARIYYGVLSEQFSDTDSGQKSVLWLSKHPAPSTELHKEIETLRETPR
jgi:outer membrane protein assembly factor BamD